MGDAERRNQFESVPDGASSRHRRPADLLRPAGIPEVQRCTNCRIRYIQEDRLCRRCSRDLGDTRSTADFDRLRTDRRKARRQTAPAGPQPPSPRRVVVIDGRAFDVVWDGT